MKQTVKLNESQLRQIIREVISEALFPGMPNFNSKDEYKKWVNQGYKDLRQKVDDYKYTNGGEINDDEYNNIYDNTPIGNRNNALKNREYNKATYNDGKFKYQPVGGAGLTFQDRMQRIKSGQPMANNHERNFITNHTQTLPNGGKKWG